MDGLNPSPQNQQQAHTLAHILTHVRRHRHNWDEWLAVYFAAVERVKDPIQALRVANRAMEPVQSWQQQQPAASLSDLPRVKYASTQFDLPRDLAEKVSDMAAELRDSDLADDGREKRPHLTIKYGLHTADPDEVRKVVEGFGPVTVTLGKTSLFEGEDADVVKIDVESSKLRELNRLLGELPHTDTHAGYNPHVTLGYVKTGRGQKYTGDDTLDGEEVTFTEVVFSDREKKETKISLTGDFKADRPLTIAVDLDGTLATYDHWRGEEHFGSLREGARETMQQLKDAGHTIIIWTCRDDEELVQNWLEANGVPFDFINANPDQPEDTSDKIAADIYLDDRGIAADQPWAKIAEAIRAKVAEKIPTHGKHGHHTSPLAVSTGKLFTPEEQSLPAKAMNGHSNASSLFRAAKEDKPAFEELARSIARRLKAKVCPVHCLEDHPEALDAIENHQGPAVVMVPLKSDRRAEEKVRADYGGDWGKLTDVLRGGIVVPGVGDFPAAVETLRSALEDHGWEMAQAPKNHFENPTEHNYRDLNVVVRAPSGTLGEFIVNTKPLYLANERYSHPIYKQVRTLKAKSDLTPEEWEARNHLENQLRDSHGRDYRKTGTKREISLSDLSWMPLPRAWSAWRLSSLSGEFVPAHAPKGGITIAGTHYPGGQFITPEAVAKATPAEKKELQEGEHLPGHKMSHDEREAVNHAREQNPGKLTLLSRGKDAEHFLVHPEDVPHWEGAGVHVGPEGIKAKHLGVAMMAASGEGHQVHFADVSKHRPEKPAQVEPVSKPAKELPKAPSATVGSRQVDEAKEGWPWIAHAETNDGGFLSVEAGGESKEEAERKAHKALHQDWQKRDFERQRKEAGQEVPGARTHTAPGIHSWDPPWTASAHTMRGGQLITGNFSGNTEEEAKHKALVELHKQWTARGGNRPPIEKAPPLGAEKPKEEEQPRVLPPAEESKLVGEMPRSRADLKRLGYMDLHASADLHPYGWKIRHWKNLRTGHHAIEYHKIREAVSFEDRKSIPNEPTESVVVNNYDEQAAFHRKIGAPVSPRGEYFDIGDTPNLFPGEPALPVEAPPMMPTKSPQAPKAEKPAQVEPVKAKPRPSLEEFARNKGFLGRNKYETTVGRVKVKAGEGFRRKRYGKWEIVPEWNMKDWLDREHPETGEATKATMKAPEAPPEVPPLFADTEETAKPPEPAKAPEPKADDNLADLEQRIKAHFAAGKPSDDLIDMLTDMPKPVKTRLQEKYGLSEGFTDESADVAKLHDALVKGDKGEKVQKRPHTEAARRLLVKPIENRLRDIIDKFGDHPSGLILQGSQIRQGIMHLIHGKKSGGESYSDGEYNAILKDVEHSMDAIEERAAHFTGTITVHDENGRSYERRYEDGKEVPLEKSPTEVTETPGRKTPDLQEEKPAQVEPVSEPEETRTLNTGERELAAEMVAKHGGSMTRHGRLTMTREQALEAIRTLQDAESFFQKTGKAFKAKNARGIIDALKYAHDLHPELGSGEAAEPHHGTHVEPEPDEEEIPAQPEPVSGTPDVRLAETLAAKLRAGEKLEAKDLWKAADEAYGGTRAEGKYGPSRAYDALETAFNLALKGRTDASRDLNDATLEAERIAEKVDQLPTQTNRSGNKEAFQQFSTPPHFAYAVNWIAHPNAKDVVLEPSAGTGCLAVHAANVGAQVYTNELDEDRADLLRHLFGKDHVQVSNAEHIASILPKRGVPAPSLVVMNPPFSQTAGRMGDKMEIMTGAKHIAEALRLLRPGGRLVSIVGRGMTPDSPTFKQWFREMGAKYNLRANVGVSGDQYKKYGTTFDTRVLVFDKPPEPGFTGTFVDSLGRTQRWEDGVQVDGDGKPKPTVTGDVDDIPALMDKLSEVRNDRPETPPAPAQSPRGEGTGTGAGGGEPALLPDSSMAPVVDEPAGERPAGIPGGRNTLPGGTPEEKPTASPGSDPAESGRPGGRPGGRGGAAEGGAVSAPEPAAPEPGGAKKPQRVGKTPKRKRGGKSPVALPELRPAERIAYAPAPVVESTTTGEGQTKSGSLYEPYHPAAIDLGFVLKHNTPLVESAAMAAVTPPLPTYQPLLSPDLLDGSKKIEIPNDDGTRSLVTVGLSDAGLEPVIYAGQAHQTFLPTAMGDIESGNVFLAKDGSRHELEEGYRNWFLTNRSNTSEVRTFDDADAVGKFLRDAEFKTNDGNEVTLPGGLVRRGYFVGDGTGAGKGRITAGIMTDNWNQNLAAGKKNKHVWITLKQNLFADAQRDWRDLGHNPGEVIHFNDIRKNPDKHEEGVAFITYDTLKGKPKKDTTGPTNLQKLIDWLGPDFDGVIAFDESHAMGNALNAQGSRGVKNASQRALAGLELQKLLPKAKVVYLSATGATEVRNMAYMDRLGLWGRETPFPSKQDFISQMESGGLAAMEAVAQSTKAMGLYGRRTLSYDGVRTEQMRHNFDADQHTAYNAIADCWQKVLQNIEKALDITNGKQDRFEKSAAYSTFWGAQQRFFNQILTSMQTPTVVQAMEQDIAEGRAPVVQLVNTMEAAQKRALGLKEDDESFEELDISPFEILTQYLEKSFPVDKYEEYEDEDGNVRVQPVLAPRIGANGEPELDPSGKIIMDPVQDPEAVAKRDELLAMAQSIRPMVMDSPLDLIINHFGHESVAEVTGRKQRLVYKVNEKGQRVRMPESRSDSANVAEADAFQSGKKKVLIFSDAGGTGKSYHADRAAQNQKQRVHYLLQPGWRADNALQGLGRTHRTNQVSAPIVRTIAVEQVPGQKRFISAIARRLESLGSLVSGQREAGSSGVFKAEDNLESKQATAALGKFLIDLDAGRVEGLEANETLRQLGFLKDQEEQGEEDMEAGGKRKRKKKLRFEQLLEIPITQFLNRLLSTRIEMQQKIFDEFSRRLHQEIEQAITNKTLDTGVENYPAVKIDRVGEKAVFKDPGTGAEAKLLTTTVHQKNDRLPWERLQSGINNNFKDFVGYVKSKRSGKVYVVMKAANPKVDAKTGVTKEQYRIATVNNDVRYVLKDSVPMTPQEQRSGMRINYEPIKKEEAESLWKQQLEELPETYTTEEHFLTGALLPVWNRIPAESNPKIFRVRTTDGHTNVGRHVPRAVVDTLLTNLGAGTTDSEGKKVHTPASAHHQLSTNHNTRVKLANGWKLKPVRVQGEKRIEITGPGWSSMQELIQDGVIKEKIAGNYRLFVPTGPDGVRVLERITRARPIAEVYEEA